MEASTSEHPVVQYVDTVGDERILWDVRGTCVVAMNRQTGPVWATLRLGRGTQSLAAAMAGHIPEDLFSRLYGSPEELARIIVGTSRKSFSHNQTALLEHGVLAEPIIRDWYSSTIVKQSIKEVGLAIWKGDPSLGGSLDGELTLEGVEEGVEIKAPKYLYRNLIEHCEAVKKGFVPPPGYHTHIFNSHYDQMIGNGVITGKRYMHYVVVANDGRGTAYYQRLPVDYNYWEYNLYPAERRFYQTYILPEMKRAKVSRIDPPCLRL